MFNICKDNWNNDKSEFIRGDIIMKKWFVNNIIKISIIFIISLIIFDYMNLPSFFGFDMHNINWGFCMAILNITIVITLYV